MKSKLLSNVSIIIVAIGMVIGMGTVSFAAETTARVSHPVGAIISLACMAIAYGLYKIAYNESKYGRIIR